MMEAVEDSLPHLDGLNPNGVPFVPGMIPVPEGPCITLPGAPSPGTYTCSTELLAHNV